MQNGHNDFGGGDPLFFVKFGWNTTAIIRHGNRTIGMNLYHNL